MKGRKLSLQEVLQLEDGSKVWVEELDKEYKEWSEVYTVNQEERRLYTKKGEFYRFDSYTFEDGDVEFYEWIEEEKESTLIMYGEIIESMANEIARHRYPNKYEYDDELIEKIIKEFS